MFCLNDGTGLTTIQNDEATLMFSPGTNPINDPLRISIPPASDPTVFVRPQAAAEKKGGKGLLIGGLIALVLLGIIGIAAVGGFVYWQNLNSRDNVVTANNSAKPNTNSGSNVSTNTTNSAANSSPTPDETAAMKQKLADLEKQLQAQKTQKGSVPILPSSPATPKTGATIARANSPGDGFLALRTEPSTVTGARILQIPHGAELTVLGCQPAAKGSKGRWCRVNYNGTAGWANDGWMTY
jgi:cytoskeletal protein RodZ